MKKLQIPTIILFLIYASIIFPSCTKDDEIIDNTTSTTHSKGDTEGDIVYDGDDYSISGFNNPGSGAYLISANDQSPDTNNVVSGYPSVKVYFKEFPTQDSTYNISINNYVSLYDEENNTTQHYSSNVTGGQTFDADVNGSDLIVTFTNLTVSYWNGSAYTNKTLSGTITVYNIY